MGQIHTDVQRIESELKRTTDSDKVYLEETLAAGGNFSSPKSNTTSLKMLLAKETSKEVESKSNPPSVIARLMGLEEDFPAKEPVLDHAKRDFRNSQSCNHLNLTEKASQQQEQHHSTHSVTQVIHPSCKTIVYNGVYEGCEDEASMRFFQEQSSQKRRYSENKSGGLDVAPEKFTQEKYLVTEENLLHSGGLQECLDVRSSERNLLLKFREEPILQGRLNGPHTTPAPPHECITVLKPMRSGGGARQSTTERAVQQKGLERGSFHQRSSSDEGTNSQPSRIVLLRPTPGKPSITKAKLTPKATPFRLIDQKNFRVLDDHGATLVSTGVVHDIIRHQQDSCYKRDEPLLSSTYSNGYCGDESSSDSEIVRDGDSEIDYIEEDGGSFSDSESGSPISKYSWDYTRRYGSSYSGSSSSKMSHFPHSLVIKEAKQRLSERWAMVTCDDISQEQVQLPRRICTLGEMLSLDEVKKEDVTTCRKDDKTGERSQKMPRSKSVPVSLYTFDNMAAKVQASNPESCKPTTDLVRRVSNFLFSKRKTIWQKSTYHPSDCFDEKIEACFGDIQLPASHHNFKTNEKLALCEEKIDISARQTFTSTSEGTASVDVPISLNCRSTKLDRLGLHEGLGSTRDQPSPTSVLDAPSEESSCNELEPSGSTTSKNTKAASRSSAVEVVACSLSWDDATSESPLPGISRPPYPPSDVEDGESECHVLVQNIMSSAGLEDAGSSIVFTGWHLPDCPLDPVLCNKLLELREQRSYQRLLFDCVNVALVEIGENALLSAFSWSKAHTRTWRGQSSPAFGVEVWSILKDWIYGARMFVVGKRDNTGIMVDRVVKQEVEGGGWVKMMMSQVVDITEQIEGGVLEELVAEAVLDFAAFNDQVSRSSR